MSRVLFTRESAAVGRREPSRAFGLSTTQRPGPTRRIAARTIVHSLHAAAPQSAATPAQPPAPTSREVTIPAGTSIAVTLLNTLASNTSHVEDAVKGSVAKPVVVAGTTAIPTGSQLTGSVLEAIESGRVKGRASIVFRFDRLVIDGEAHKIQTASVKKEAAADKKSDVKKGGVGAGAGAIVGGVIGGGKGAAIGAVAGGTTAVMATKGNEIEVPSGTVVTVLLQDPVTVMVPVK